jgi:hypothetical protein
MHILSTIIGGNSCDFSNACHINLGNGHINRVDEDYKGQARHRAA